jgi:hypothetical protein
VNLTLCPNQFGIREQQSDADHERLYLTRLGVARIIKLAMQAHHKFDAPAITIQREPNTSAAVLSLIGVAGAIEHG